MFLGLFLIVTYHNNPLLFNTIDNRIKTHGGDLISNYWQDIKSRYFPEEPKVSSTVLRVSSNRRSYVSATKPTSAGENTFWAMGSLAYQAFKHSVGNKMVVAGSKISAGGTKLATSSKLSGVGAKLQATGNTLASSAVKTPGVMEGLKIGSDGFAATGAASLVMVGGSAVVLATGVDQVARHKLEGYVNSDDPSYKQEPFKMQPPLEAWVGKPK
jgi:hypothetical protein